MFLFHKNACKEGAGAACDTPLDPPETRPGWSAMAQGPWSEPVLGVHVP